MSITVKTNAGSQQRKAILQIVQAQLKDVGVDVRAEFLDAGTLTSQVFSAERDFDGVLTSLIADFKLDDRDLFLSSRIDGPLALSGLHDTTMDRLLDTLQLVVDHARARPLWIEYERAQQEEEPFLLIYYVKRLAGLRRALHGAEMDTRGEWVNLQHWWLDPAARRGG